MNNIDNQIRKARRIGFLQGMLVGLPWVFIILGMIVFSMCGLDLLGRKIATLIFLSASVLSVINMAIILMWKE